MEKLYLFDGFGIIFRAFHAMSRANLYSPTQIPIGALYGFANTLTSFIELRKPTHMAVVFDTSEPTFRHKMYPEYKANRQAFPEELIPQVPEIKRFIDLAGIPRIELNGYEADDIVGTFCHRFGKDNTTVYCITSDKDYCQLVSNNVRLIKPGKEESIFEELGEEYVLEKFGVSPKQVIDVLAIMGDSSDNIPGVKGVGPKGAIPLVQQYGSIEKIYEHLDEIASKSIKEKFALNKEMAMLSKQLVTIDTDVPINFSVQDFVLQEKPSTQLDDFFAEMSMVQLRKKWAARLHSPSSGEIKTISVSVPKTLEAQSPTLKNIHNTEHNYTTVQSYEQLQSIVDTLSQQPAIAFDLETTGIDTMLCDIVGIALSSKAGEGIYIPVMSETEIDESPLFTTESMEETPKYHNLDTAKVIEIVKPLLESPKVEKWSQNGKFDAVILKRYGITVSPMSVDSMLSSFILNTDSKHGMDALAIQWLKYDTIKFTSLIPEKELKKRTLRSVSIDKVSTYAAEDADVTFQLCSILKKELEKEEKLAAVAKTIEFPLMEVLTQMEYNGIAIDIPLLKDLSVRIDAMAKEHEAKVIDLAGMSFNLNSPKQLADVLFVHLNLPSAKKNKTGFSTDEVVLRDLVNVHPIAQHLLEYRSLVKLKSTYVDALPKMVNPHTKRVHTTYSQTTAGTGRLASFDPNLQNIPIKTELGREVRKAFIPQFEGMKILSVDYSQIELRIMASMCEDPTLIQAFVNGEDIHKATAAMLYGVATGDVTSDMRRVAKTVNFGIMYGQGAFGLAAQLEIPRNEAKSIIDTYFEKYPNIKKFIESTVASTKQHGYAETLAGRRRYFPDINSQNHTIRTATERAAVNMPIQGTAADMMKVAMIKIHNTMKQQNFQSKLMLQVHDELVFEVIPEELETLPTLIKGIMESAFPLPNVPVVAESGIGNSWFEAH